MPDRLRALEGQYFIKNIVLIGAAMVVGAAARGGRLVPQSDRQPARVRSRSTTLDSVR